MGTQELNASRPHSLTNSLVPPRIPLKRCDVGCGVDQPDETLERNNYGGLREGGIRGRAHAVS